MAVNAEFSEGMMTYVACFFFMSTEVLFVWCVITCFKESQYAQGNNIYSFYIN
jgi:hypothetical protein